MIDPDTLVRKMLGSHITWRDDETQPENLEVFEGAAYYGTKSKLFAIRKRLFALQAVLPVCFISVLRPVPSDKDESGFVDMMAVARVSPLDRIDLQGMVEEHPEFQVPCIPKDALADFITGTWWVRGMAFEIDDNLACRWRKDLGIRPDTGKRKHQKRITSSGQKRRKRREVAVTYPSNLNPAADAAVLNMMDEWGFKNVTHCVTAALMYFHEATLRGDVREVKVPGNVYEVRAAELAKRLAPFAKTPREKSIMESLMETRNIEETARRLSLASPNFYRDVFPVLAARREAVLSNLTDQ